MKLRRPWQQRLAGRIGSIVLRLLAFTWRGRSRLRDLEEPGLYLSLHAHILFIALCGRDLGFAAMISTHRDGELIAQTVQRLGFTLVRGSSTRGGAAAALGVLRGCRDKVTMITPDGPRGPRGKVEPGLIQLAGLAGLPIRILSFAASRARKLSSWDRFVVPMPFARIHYTLSEPIVVPKRIDDSARDALVAELSRRLLEAEQAAERDLAS
ncbi:MAG: lysophospholipid acyltransferase family protein [Planctomycetota bacterium]